MQTPFVLLKYLAKGLGNALGGGIAGEVLVELVPGLVQDVWEWWSKGRSPEERRIEIEAISQAGGQTFRQAVKEIVEEVVSGQPPGVRQTVEDYLTQVPVSARRSLRRLSDPTGTSVPIDLVPLSAEDLIALLPPGLPRFKPGQHPLPGVDWELEELLGVGGFGEVWKARNPHLSGARPVALKFCLDSAAAKTLRIEAAVLDRVMRQGDHPGIVRLLHTYLSADTPCLEYEYIEGGDLTGLIQESHRKTKGLPRSTPPR